MNEKFFVIFILEKIIFCILIWCNKIFNTLVFFPEGMYCTKLNNYGGGVGGGAVAKFSKL